MFGIGWATAEDRLFFIDALRHAGQGDLAQFAGGANVAMDEGVWANEPYTQGALVGGIFGQGGGGQLQNAVLYEDLKRLFGNERYAVPGAPVAVSRRRGRAARDLVGYLCRPEHHGHVRGAAMQSGQRQVLDPLRLLPVARPLRSDRDAHPPRVMAAQPR